MPATPSSPPSMPKQHCRAGCCRPSIPTPTPSAIGAAKTRVKPEADQQGQPEQGEQSSLAELPGVTGA